MTTELLVPFYAGTAVSTAVTGGVFLAFSDFLMRSLKAAHPQSGVEAMQMINRKVYKSIFLTSFLGIGIVSAGTIALLVTEMISAGATQLSAAGMVYLAGVFAVTVVFNVPMNKKLDKMNLIAPETHEYWSYYASRWTFWNHVRSAACILSAILFLQGAFSIAAA